MINRFKGLDLVDRVPEDLWIGVHYIVQKVVTKTIPKKTKCKEAKWLSEEAFQIAEESTHWKKTLILWKTEGKRSRDPFGEGRG